MRPDLVKIHTGTVKTYKPHTEKRAVELESNTESSLHEGTVLSTAPMATFLDFDRKITSCMLYSSVKINPVSSKLHLYECVGTQ